MDKKVITASVILLTAVIAFASISVVSATDYAVTITGPSVVGVGEKFTVRGTYTEDGVPVAGVKIDVQGLVLPSTCSVCHATQDSYLGSTITNENGVYEYEVGPIDGGPFVLHVHAGADTNQQPLAQSEPLTVNFGVTKASVVTEVQDIMGRTGATPAAFSTTTDFKAYTNKLNALAKTIEAGNYAEAQAKITNDLMKRNDQWVTKDPIIKQKLDAGLQNILDELAVLQAG